MRARQFALAKLLVSVPSRTLRASPFPSTCASQRFLMDIRERAWMWVRAKVKPVAGVVEVGRIRVTDQRAPREPALEKPRPRRGGALGLIENAYREQNSHSVYLAICLPACLSSLLLSFFLYSSLSASPSHPWTIWSSSFFPKAPLSFSLHDRLISFFVYDA